MQTLDSLRRQIDSADELRGIVRTMKTMAAVSIRQYQQAVEALGEYHRSTQMGLRAVLESEMLETAPQPARHNARGVAVIFGSDQGMCGQFNEQIAAYGLQALARNPASLVMAVGERARARLAASGQAISASLPVPASAAGITPLVQRLLLTLDDWRAEHPVGQVMLYFNAPVSGATYTQRSLRLAPVNLQALRHSPQSAWPPRSRPMFTLDSQRLLSALLSQHLFVTVFRALAESLAAENASRLASMHAAERNIEERLEELSMSYHQQRQTAITSELLDIVSGFEVLTSP